MSTEETEEESAAPTTGAPAAEAAAAETEEAAAAVSNKSDARHSEHEAARLRARIDELEADAMSAQRPISRERQVVDAGAAAPQPQAE